MNYKKSLTNFILLGLEKAIDGYLRFEDFTTHSYIYARGYDRPLKKAALSQALKRLREGGFVELIEDKEIIIRLTEKGYDRALWFSLGEAQEWDGKWRLVIFDIPEKRRIARDTLRRKLKDLGFVRWQRSVWASKVDCTEPLRKFIKKVGIEEWVMVIESENVGPLLH